MIVQAPCRLGESFLSGPGGPWKLTEISFYKWEDAPAGNINVGERLKTRRGISTAQTIYAQQTSAEVRHSIELPDSFVTGGPLRALGMDTDAVGRLQGIQLTEHSGHQYIVYYGMEFGGTPAFLHSRELDRLFADILPQRAVAVDLKTFL